MFTVRVSVPPLAGHYRCLMADPPWLERGAGQIKRGADRHYPLMHTRDIALLPVNELAAPDAHLYLWVTNNFLEDGLLVMKAWGFRYVTCLTWFKKNEHGRRQVGLGQYFRGCTEHVLFGVRGNCEYRETPDGKRAQGQTGFEAPRTNVHSEKPGHVRHWAEQVSHGPYLELFARRPSDGWDLWGNEAPVEQSG